ncbi:MAG TPA: nucleotidyltransferase family protein [Bacillota bacterium]|nr:nucleotidyltransferase family protein [Bacillota bacterium]
MKNISCILLAAGLSQRMGQLKALLEWEGKPLIKYQVEQMKLAGVQHIHVVLGYRKEDIEKQLVNEDVYLHWNERYEQGKSTSIRKGASHLTDDSVATFISSVDQPVQARTLTQMVHALKQTDKSIVIPTMNQRKGHPLLLARSKFDELLQVNEETEGLRHLIQMNEQDIHFVSINDPSILYNFNTIEDYERHRREGKKQ